MRHPGGTYLSNVDWKKHASDLFLICGVFFAVSCADSISSFLLALLVILSSAFRLAGLDHFCPNIKLSVFKKGFCDVVSGSCGLRRASNNTIDDHYIYLLIYYPLRFCSVEIFCWNCVQP